MQSVIEWPCQCCTQPTTSSRIPPVSSFLLSDLGLLLSVSTVVPRIPLHANGGRLDPRNYTTPRDVDSERAPPNVRGGGQSLISDPLAGPPDPPRDVDIWAFDIIRRKGVHMSTVSRFWVDSCKLSQNTAVYTNRVGVHTALGPQRGVNFGPFCLLQSAKTL